MRRLFVICPGMNLYVAVRGRPEDLVERCFDVREGCFLLVEVCVTGWCRGLLDDGMMVGVQSDLLALNCDAIG